MAESAADIWAYCTECERWFACPDAAASGAAGPTCPVCAHAPSVIENRATLAAPPS